MSNFRKEISTWLPKPNKWKTTKNKMIIISNPTEKC